MFTVVMFAVDIADCQSKSHFVREGSVEFLFLSYGRHFAGKPEENLKLELHKPRNGYFVAATGHAKHEVGTMEIFENPCTCRVFAVNGMAEQSEPVVAVLDKPCLGLLVLANEVAESGEFGIAGIDEPVEKLVLSGHGLLQSQQNPYIIFQKTFVQGEFQSYKFLAAQFGTEFLFEIGLDFAHHAFYLLVG